MAEVFTIDWLIGLDVASRVISQLGAVNRLRCNQGRVKCAADNLVSRQVGDVRGVNVGANGDVTLRVNSDLAVVPATVVLL